MFYNLGVRRPDAAADGRDRVRHHARARACATCCSPARSRRASPAPDAGRPAGLRRGGAGRAADRPGGHASWTSPRRWPTWPSAGRSTARPRAWSGCCTPRDTFVHLVTLLEDMPVTETLETIGELRAADLRPGAVIVNRVRPQWLPARSVAAAANGRLDAGRIRPGWPRPGSTWPRRCSTAWSPRPSSTPSGCTPRPRRCAQLRRRPALPLLELPAAGRRRRPRRRLRAGRLLRGGRGRRARAAAGHADRSRPGPRPRRAAGRPRTPGSWSPAAPAGSARPPPPPRWRCGPPNAAARSWC